MHLVKIVLDVLAVSALLSLCACTVPASPTAPSAAVAVDAAASTAFGFEPAFYRAFLQNAFDAPDHLEPVRVLQSPLRIYMRTEDDAGSAIDAITLATTFGALNDSVRIWSGNTFGIAEFARGSGTREKVPGWITVKWSTSGDPSRCGRSTVGVDGGYIELNVSGSCSCGMATRVYPRVVRHELGHAMGYYHTDDQHDVMYGQSITTDACDILPSERERLHARLAHSQPQ
jgi:hypothetical protein